MDDATINHLGFLQSMRLDDNITRLITDYNPELKDEEFCKNICTLQKTCASLFKTDTSRFIFPIEQGDKKLYDKIIPEIRQNIETHHMYNIKKVTLKGVGAYID